MPSVFIAHTHTDKPLARKLCHDLLHYGVRVWFDEAEIRLGDSLIRKVRKAIDEMEYLAVILSPEAVESEWVQNEVDTAMSQQIEGRTVNSKVTGFG